MREKVFDVPYLIQRVRIADRVTNICERVVFTATGVLDELPRSG